MAEVVVEDVYVDPRPHVERHPTADEPHGERAEKQEYLGQEERSDDAHVALPDAVVHQRLRQERGDQREERPAEQPESQLPHLPLIGPYVLPGKADEAVLLLDRHLPVELLRGLNGYHHALLPAQPRAGELGLGEGVLPVGGIRHAVAPFPRPAAPAYGVEHDEMVLLPVEYGRQGAELAQLGERHAERSRLHAYLPQRVADARHAHPLAAQVGQGAQIGERIVLPVVAGHHADAGRAAVHLVELAGKPEGLEPFAYCLEHTALHFPSFSVAC